MKDRIFAGIAVGLLLTVGILATRATDVIFPAASIAFFVICIAYAEGCERL